MWAAIVPRATTPALGVPLDTMAMATTLDPLTGICFARIADVGAIASAGTVPTVSVAAAVTQIGHNRPRAIFIAMWAAIVPRATTLTLGVPLDTMAMASTLDPLTGICFARIANVVAITCAGTVPTVSVTATINAEAWIQLGLGLRLGLGLGLGLGLRLGLRHGHGLGLRLRLRPRLGLRQGWRYLFVLLPSV
jgi:hypothetical protein